MSSSGFLTGSDLDFSSLWKRCMAAKRRAPRWGAGGSFYPQDIRRLFDEQDGFCVECCESFGEDFHIDHIIPLSLEGSTNGPENLQLLCPSCNRSKGKKPFWWYTPYAE
jgi:5-methylcytosine-specific restriction endonuclease McrA